ncbi:cytochrome P450 [Nakamurella antarctica]|uniref:Cytochrome P450 n=1 Tax=Nakamurella antarctica TaxID=1902245 RepID=A0A3G8ZNZ1_9ACTN|nr:cytochrome P450 [Nakamurella antarctica]AZI58495.1 cytochrome P450 [Nakamurella antarctica]
MSAHTTPLQMGFDPEDTGFISNPYPVFTALREAGPLLFYPEQKLWLLTTFADVHASLRNRSLGRMYEHKYTPAEFGQPEPSKTYPRWQESERWSMLNLEPPDHTRLRRLVTKVFTPKSVAALRPQVAQFSQNILDTCVARGEFDLIADYAQPYSVAVICELLGVPQADGPSLLRWSHGIVKMYEFSNSAAQRQNAEDCAAEFIDYVRALIRARRSDPQPDLISQLVSVADEGDTLTDDEIICTVIVLLNAGHEATVNTLGNGMRALMKHRRQWDRLTSGEVTPQTAVEELIRFDAPLQLFQRWVLEEGVVIAGREFAVGEQIGMMFGVANRDPARFPDPDTFDIGRGDANHIGFGGGTHFCIGAPLARLELEISLNQILAAAPQIELAAEPEYHPQFVIRGLKALRVRM